MTGRTPPYDDHPTGILGLPGHLPYRVRRAGPQPELAWCVENYWATAWEFAPGHGATARILPHPSVNLTLEQSGLIVTGIAAGVFTRRLSGVDGAFGVKFRPGAFRPFLDMPVRELSGVGMSAHGLLAGSTQLEANLRAAGSFSGQADVVADYVAARGLRGDDTVELVARVVRALVHDPEIRRVGDACSRFDISERALQRLFAEYVGVSPRWVLRRGRLHAAADRVIELAAGGRPGGWADLAADLGYVDQAHFIRDFRDVVGVPPGRWASELLTVD